MGLDVGLRDLVRLAVRVLSGARLAGITSAGYPFPDYGTVFGANLSKGP